jgi:predicted deacylase
VFRFAGVEVGPGARRIVKLSVTMMATGQPLEIPVHIFAGDAPRPVAALLSTHHGDEVFTIEVLRAVSQALMRARPNGTVLLIPVANPIAFESGTRHTPLDMMNLNRVFPGTPGGWLSDRIAHVLSEALLPGVDVLLDYHCGAEATEIEYTYTRPQESEVTRKIHRLALLSGARVVWETPLPAGTLAGEAERRGIPWCVFEVGGSPAFNTAILDFAVSHTMDVLRATGVLPGTPRPSRAEVLVRRGTALRPGYGGLFLPEAGSEVLGGSVARGTTLARVISPYTFEEIEVLRAPYEPTYVMMARTRPSRVHPGDYAYLLGDGGTATSLR